MPNSLTREAGLKVGPLLLETLFKHYFTHIKSASASNSKGNNDTLSTLRKNELLYDQAFTVVKAFMEAATLHTVEELQRFSNAKTPNPPWIHVVKLTIPMICCDDAATHLIQALGGEDVAKRVVGGVKWWQVRGLQGIDAEWITMKKDYQKAKKRRQESIRIEASLERTKEGTESDGGPEKPSVYEPEMDDMRCILYLHGGGYYFGSVDQERYGMQRLARKISGRVFAVNYRLSPQYPFPCAIQDILAAYLFLIRPPPGASHTPVKPSHIVIGGDSAGGGLALALLQVIRDSGLPLPAGGLLISPWCDLTHSFPSINTNSEKDIIPFQGLAFHKPSVLWPPPPAEITNIVHAGIRQRIQRFTGLYSNSSSTTLSGLGNDSGVSNENKWYTFKKFGRTSSKTSLTAITNGSSSVPISSSSDHSKSSGSQKTDHKQVNMRNTASLPPADNHNDQTISLTTSEGAKLTIKSQVQLYAPNNLLGHPLVSPVLAYLGDLPPLFVIAGQDEVLRDEIVYLAHMAAHPDKYPIRKKVKEMYPILSNPQAPGRPTQVHLQIYDDAPHTLPVLFPFVEPSKYCYRAMASFCKYVTGMLSGIELDLVNDIAERSETNNLEEQEVSILNENLVTSPQSETPPRIVGDSVYNRINDEKGKKLLKPNGHSRILFRSNSDKPEPRLNGKLEPHQTHGQHRPRSALADSRSDSFFRRVFHEKANSSGLESNKQAEDDSKCLAGDPIVYMKANGATPFKDNMIRERVAINGVLRDLESEDELAACQQPLEGIGVVSEKAAKRYLNAVAIWDKRFASSSKSIAKRRVRNLNLARKNDTIRNVEQLQMHFYQNASDTDQKRITLSHEEKSIQEGLEKTAASWSWAWAFDADERPPPSSIVSRRDTQEARRLSKIADQPTTAIDDHLSGNSLWTVMINMLTPEQRPHTHPDKRKSQAKKNGEGVHLFSTHSLFSHRTK